MKVHLGVPGPDKVGVMKKYLGVSWPDKVGAINGVIQMKVYLKVLWSG